MISTFVAAEEENDLLTQIPDLLTEGRDGEGVPTFLDRRGVRVQLPATLSALITRAVEAFLDGERVTLVPSGSEMTTGAAADFLNVSRPFIVKLMDSGVLEGTKVGSHRRISFATLLQYKESRDAERRRDAERYAEPRFVAASRA